MEFCLANENDVGELLALEKFVNPAYRASRAALHERVQKGNGEGAGALLMIQNKEICGVLYFVRTLSDSDNLTYDNILQAKNDNGDVARWIHIIVSPAGRSMINKFYQHAKEFCFNNLQVSSIRAMTHCSSFDSGSMEEYIHGSLKTDKNLFFHSSRGARFVRVIQGYNARDERNGGCCVEMIYTRVINTLKEEIKPPSQSVDHAGLEMLVKDVLGLDEDECIDAQTPWFELGLDSISLMELHSNIEAELNVSLDVSFLFGVNTFEKLCRHFRGCSSSKDSSDVSTVSTKDESPPGKPLPVIGIGIRFPGEATSLNDIETLEAFWNALLNDDGNKASYKRLRNRSRFNGKAFKELIPEEQARCIPLSQRLVLDTVLAALADGPEGFLDSVCRRVGVFVGAWDKPDGEYSSVLHGQGDPVASTYAIAGTSLAILANRISFLLDLNGPSVVLDTACSSSLVALDYARLSISEGKCDAAIVVGVNVVDEQRSALLQRASFLSPSGACHAFDARADGYSRSEGCGAILVGSTCSNFEVPPRAFILSTVVNQDGRTANLHAPNPASQEALLRAACTSAKIDASDLAFLQSHGTGTSLGDPIEAFAIEKSIGLHRGGQSDPLWIASIKSQFGHLEAAAGIIGVITAIASLQQKMLPANKRLEETNKAIAFKGLHIRPVGTTDVAIKKAEIVAGVSSFGFGGTNAHVILKATSSDIVPFKSRMIMDKSRCVMIPFQPFLERSAVLEKDEISFLKHHRVASTSVLPGSFLAFALLDLAGISCQSKLRFGAFTPLGDSCEILARYRGKSTVEVFVGKSKVASCETTRNDVPNPICNFNELYSGLKDGSTRNSLIDFYDKLGNKYEGAFRGLIEAKASNDADSLLNFGRIEVESTHKLKMAALLDIPAHLCFTTMPTALFEKPVYAAGYDLLWIDFDNGLKPHGTIFFCVAKKLSANKFDWDLRDKDGRLLACARAFEFGYLESNDKTDPPAGIEVFTEAWTQRMSIKGSELQRLVVREFSCANLHRRILEAVDQGFPPILVCMNGLGQNGYMRSVKREFPSWDILCTTASDAQVIESLRQCALGARELELDSTGTLTRRLWRQSLTSSSSPSSSNFIVIKKGGVYLITGGNGAIGSKIAEACLERGAGKLIVVSRGGVKGKQEGVVDVRCDVSDLEALRNSLKDFVVNGFFHCAGALDDGMLRKLPGFEKCFNAKVRGAENLIRLFPQADFGVLCSSITAAFGAPGQANYAAANAALDALAEMHEENLLSVQWGPWAGEEGMASNSEQRWIRMGIEPIDSASAIRTLFELPHEGPAVRLLAKIDTGASFVQGTGFFDEEVAHGSARKANVEIFVQEVTKDFIDDKDFDLDLPWREAGLDSLSMVELRNALQRSIASDIEGFELRDTVLFDYPTPRKLIAYLRISASGSTPMKKETLGTKLSLSSGEEICVTGVSCRLPGGVKNPDHFWKLLILGRDAITPIPLGRFDFETQEGLYATRGAFLEEDNECFDHERFGISEKEALLMDPQQRISLQVAQEALSEAKIDTEEQVVGVYVGVMTNDWASLLSSTKAKASAYSASGHIPCVIANRISYTLGLSGPSMSLDTACSSSLVALDAACTAIIRGDCDVAVVIGVNLILSPELFVEECAARMLSFEGRCATFSDDADGYVRGEGCVALVIEAASRSANKPTWGRILASAVNQDGRSANLTSPNGVAQCKVIQKALQRANLNPDDVQFLETHGTGTPLGDPMEIGAITDAHHGRTTPLSLGAVKTVVGHGEAAAGVTSILKALLCIKEGVIPGNLHMRVMNPKVAKVAAPWMRFPVHGKEEGRLPKGAIGGISGFGFGGTNVHVIVAGPSPGQLYPQKQPIEYGGHHILPWSVHFEREESFLFSLEWQAVIDVAKPSGFEREEIEVLQTDQCEEVLDFVCANKEKVALHVMINSTNPAVWGLVRSFRLEFPRWTWRLTNNALGASLSSEPEFHVIEGEVVVPRLVPLEKRVSPMGLSMKDECVLVTGASGGIGKAIVSFLLDVGVGRIIALSRSKENIPKDPRVVHVIWDIKDQLKLLKFDTKVTVILHCAGILRECRSTELTREILKAHMEVKVQGTRNLLKTFPEAAFFGFSSTSVLFGMKSGSAYAAANGAMDAEVAEARKQGHCAISIWWDIWKETGMAHDRDMVKSSERGLTNNHALQSLVGLIKNRRELKDNVAVIETYNWNRLQKQISNAFMLSGLAQEAEKPEEHLEANSIEEKKNLSLNLQSTSKEEREKALLSFLLEQAGSLAVEGKDTQILGPNTPWQQAGFDSLMMTELSHIINEALGIEGTDEEVSDSFMFDYPTPAKVAEVLASSIRLEDVEPQVRKIEAEVLHEEPEVTVVGIGLRFPGPAANCDPEGFWQFLKSGGDAVRAIPESRISKKALEDSACYVNRAAFLHPDNFHVDIGGKFPISASECEKMDPHQRIALQVAADAIGTASKNGADLSKAGVYVGAQNTEFMLSQANAVSTFTATGTALSIIANRISFALNLTGPSMTIDTACSSSLAALDVAVKALHAGDCTSALVLGVDLLLSPHRFETTCAAQMLSPNGRCATFSSEADGYARGEGCGGIVITLDKSRSGQAWGLIRGMALNQDGQSANLTSPRGPAQIECIQKALDRAGVEDLEAIDFVESHGTGTKLGDPQELEALATVFKGRKAQLPVGAVKTRIGHLEAAAGIAGVIKCLLALRFGELPLNLHCEELNPRIENLRRKCDFRFPVDGAITFEHKPKERMLAGVSSFGFGGTNGHVILQGVSDERAVMLGSSNTAILRNPAPAFVVKPLTNQKWQVEMPSYSYAVIVNHKVGSLPVLPATTYIEMIQPIMNGEAFSLEDLRFEKMHFLDPSADFLSVLVSQKEGRRLYLSIDGQEVASMTANRDENAELSFLNVLSEFQTECTTVLDAGKPLYDTIGNNYCGPFRKLSRAWSNGDKTKLLGEVDVDLMQPRAALAFVWLDVASHVGLAAMKARNRQQPVFAKAVKSYRSASAASKLKAVETGRVWSTLELVSKNTYNMNIIGEDGTILARVNEFSFGFFAAKVPGKTGHAANIYVDTWVPAPSMHSSRTQMDLIPAQRDLMSLKSELLAKQSNDHGVVVHVGTEEQKGFIACYRKENPRLQVVALEGELPSILNLPEKEDNVLVKDGIDFVRRLTTFNASPDDGLPLEEDGAYLVTGGLGALGRAVAIELVRHGAGKILLIGRSPPPASWDLPKECSYVQCDLSSCGRDVSSIARKLSGSIRDIQGIFHCAGVLKDSTFANIQASDVESVFDAKVWSAKNLKEVFAATDGAQPKFWVLFSSIAANFGSAGQAVYGAANAALDGFARRWNEEGDRSFRAFSVRWGPWAEAGMATSGDSLQKKWTSMGLFPMQPSNALAALFSLPWNSSSESVFTICDFDSEKQHGTYFADLQKRRELVVDQVFAEAEADVSQRQGQLPRSRQEIYDIVMSIAEEVNPTVDQAFEEDEGWRDAGLDSLGMVEFRNRLEDEFESIEGFELDETLLFDYPTPKELIDWLVQQVEELAPPPANGNSVKVDQGEHVESTPSIAVTAGACRLPGHVKTLQEFWRLLCSGDSAMTRVPLARFDIGEVFSPEVGEPGKSYTDKGGFIDDVELFDNARFRISDKEAQWMDPQQRLALECAYEALIKAKLLGTSCKVGVYVGIMTHDWNGIGKNSSPSPFTATGWSPAIVANRISFHLGLTGPSMAIDTACSSSLVALDAAQNAIARGDCDAAIVVGVNLILSVDLYVEECAARMLSPNGRCATLASGADGYARGEGCVALVLQRGADADSPIGYLMSTAVNQDGKSANLTSPNGRAQQEVIQIALKRGNVEHSRIQYIETHGTGTALGDPLEVGSLAKVFSNQELILGASKACVGHTEGAAGLTSVLKALLCLYHESVPGNPSLQEANDISAKVLKVASKGMRFPLKGELLKLRPGSLAGVSAFGFGGTNAHAILSSSHRKEDPDALFAPPSIDWHRKRFSWRAQATKHALEEAGFAKGYAMEMFGSKDIVPGHVALDMLLFARAELEAEIHIADVSISDAITSNESFKVSEDKKDVKLAQKSLVKVGAESQSCKHLQHPSTSKKVLSRSSAWFEEELACHGWRQDRFETSSIELEDTAQALWMKLSFRMDAHMQDGYLLSPYVFGEMLLALCLLFVQKQNALQGKEISCLPVLDRIRSVHVLDAFNLRKFAKTGKSECIATVLGDADLLINGEPVLLIRGAEFVSNKCFGDTSLFTREFVACHHLDTPRLSRQGCFDESDIMHFVDPVESFDDRNDAAFQQWCIHLIQTVFAKLGPDFVPRKPELRLVLNRWKRRYISIPPVELPNRNPKGVEFDFICNCADQLESIMRGEREAIDVLFSNSALTTRLYSESTPSLACNSAISQAVEGCVKAVKASSNCSIRILELGAGTGGTTMHILPKLDRYRTEYVFTDISDYFLRNAAKTFEEYDDMLRFKLLNVEEDLESQGFAEAQFDIVVASNIIHATADLGVTLRNVRKLLANGGVFLLNEATELTAFLDSTFALTSGWWRFTNKDSFRPALEGPLLQVDEWRDVLTKKCGFEGGFSLVHAASQKQCVMAAIAAPLKATELNSHLLTCRGLFGADVFAHQLSGLVKLDESASCALVMPALDIAMLGDLKVYFEYLRKAAERNSRVTKLVIVTRIEQNAWHAAFDGVMRSLAKEVGEAKLLICLDVGSGTTSAQVVQMVATELAKSSTKSILQVRAESGDRFVARLRPLFFKPNRKRTKKLSGTYVITGGLGGLGLVTARVLQSLGIEHLVLLSRAGKLRTGLESTSLEEKLYKEIISRGCCIVRSIACDVTDPRALETLFDNIDGDANLPEVRGIVHSAGMLRNNLLSDMSFEDDFVPVAATKSCAAICLDEICCSRGYDLETFLIYSSAASLFGSEGQCNHSAANAVMDQVVKNRRLRGLPGTAVQWGGWNDIGAAADSSHASKSILSRGMGLIPVEQGRRMIHVSLLEPEAPAVFGLTPLNWERFPSSEVDDAFISHFTNGRVSSVPEKPRSKRTASAPAIVSADQNEVHNVIEEILQECGIHSMNYSLEEQGLDSLSSVEIIGAVKVNFGVKLTPTFYLDLMNGEGVVKYVLEELGRSQGASTADQQEVGLSPWIEPLFGPDMRIFCFAYAGGHPNVFQDWVKFLPGNLQLCPMSMPGYGKQTDHAFWLSVPDLAGAIFKTLPRDRPFVLVGSCLGSIISFEVNRLIQRSKEGRMPDHLVSIACSAPHDYARALRLLYSDRLKENPFFVPSSEADAIVRFSDLSQEQRDHTIIDLHKLGFFKDEETMNNLVVNQTYFEHVMSQIAGQMQLAERYEFHEMDSSLCQIPITAISGKLDETIPQGWPAQWIQHGPKQSFEHIEIQDGGHYIVQTHPQQIVNIILRRIKENAA